MKSVYLVFVLSFVYNICLSQSTLVGKIVDESNSPMYGATVVLLNIEDSTMVSFALTNDRGLYKMEGVDQGEYIVQTSFVSYDSYSEVFTVDGSSQMEIPLIQMKPSSEILNEVTVKAEHVPMGIKGDTISYNANAFKTRPNATVEDLLKKLPGIEVDRRGNIKAQGEDVQNVLVDGKEFFGGDPKMATQNLEAEAVDKVEVYDKKSEIAEFTGIDDGQEEKTINLQLKEDFKNGGFGNVEVGLGSDSRYAGKGNYFRFSPSFQASLIGASNNLNRETFTVEDQIEFMGGIGNFLSGGRVRLSNFSGLGEGINQSTSTGVNLNYEPNNKVKLNFNYVFNGVGNDLEKNGKYERFSDDLLYESTDSIESTSSSNIHKFYSRFKYKINPFFEVDTRNNVNVQDENVDRRNGEKYSIGGQPSGMSSSDYSSNINRLAWDSKTWLKSKFKKKGRSWISTLTYKYNNDDSYDKIRNINQVLSNDLSIIQDQNYRSSLNYYGVGTNYTEPLSKRYFLGFSYNYNQVEESPSRDFFDFIDNEKVLNDSLSLDFEKNYFVHTAGLQMRRNLKRVKMSFGLNRQWTILNGSVSQNELNVRNKFSNWLPRFQMDYDLRGGKNFQVNYTTQIDAPTLEQLLPVKNNVFSNYVYQGNPNLVPTYIHQLSVRYSMFDNFNFTNFWVSLDGSYQRNNIVDARSIDSDLFETVSPINADQYWNTGIFMSYGQPIRKLKIDYRIRTNIRYSEYDNLINSSDNQVRETFANLKLQINNRKTKKIYFETGVSLNWNRRLNSLDKKFNQSFYNLDYFLEYDWQLGKNWSWNVTLTIYRYSNDDRLETPNYSILNSTISKSFLDQKLQLRFSVNDILNQNQGIRRYAEGNSFGQYEYNNLGRYGLISLVYKIGRGKDKEGMHIEID